MLTFRVLFTESMNYSWRPPLEISIAHASELLRLMSNSNLGACAFVTVDDMLHETATPSNWLQQTQTTTAVTLTNKLLNCRDAVRRQCVKIWHDDIILGSSAISILSYVTSAFTTKAAEVFQLVVVIYIAPLLFLLMQNGNSIILVLLLMNINYI